MELQVRMWTFILLEKLWMIDFFLFSIDMFRDHGFVESMPQQWSLKEKVWEFTVREGDQLLTFRNPSYDITFELRQEEDGLIVLEFIDIIDFESVEDHFLPWFREEVRRLNRMHDLEWKKTNPGVPQHEWESILAFHQAYLHALKVVLVFSEDDVPEEKFDEFEAGLEHHYNEFDRDEADRLGYNYQNCPSSEISDFRHYQPYEQKESYYQTMKWQHRPEDEDMCLHLDDMLQICSSYRPHYHEFFVHYPARYMESVKRVIFLGSGDAMLLHEILKYPDLELVVGLELDQAITRNSFKYFTTQPHYDDERVHWWYGDATKTLPLLPKEYWGSFDLALVDLSETVVSMSVTGQHDILEVISMLLKPEGVMLENELYLHKMDKHFDHTIQIFYGSPKVCTQVLTMSSNAVDFFRDKIYDHGIDSYLLKPIKEPHDRFKYIHDYIKSNAQSQGKCHASLGEGDAEETTVEYGRVAGILQIVEAENTSIPLDETIEGKIHSVLLEQGFTPISKLASNTGVQIAVVIMEEGYVIARMWPEHNYCGLDINLWGGFQKSGQLERALLGSLGSSSPSSYRVVVGGMHGSTTFEKDKEEIGVQISQKRNCKTQDLSQKARVDNETVMRVFAEVINLLESRELVVAVVCAGLENDCSIFNAVSEHSSVQRIVPIRACHGNGGIQDMHECENKILSEIEETVISKGLKLDVLLFDSKAPKSMYQLLNSIFTVERYRESWFQNRYVIAAPFLKDENLQQRFLEAYRKEEHHSTLFRADVTLKGRDQSFAGVSVILHGDDFALDQFYGMERSLQTMMDLSIEIESIIGGDLHPVADLEEETLSFGPDKYDASLARKQFAEQTPVGRHSVIQLELIDDEDDIEMPSFPELLGGLKATLEELNYTRSRVETFDGTDAATGVVGEGGVVIVVCSEGSVGLVWDGRHHVDINLFAYDEDELTANIFLNTFLRQTGDRLEPRLRDDQPRGFGRVVSFSKEIEEYEPPLAVVRTAV